MEERGKEKGEMEKGERDGCVIRIKVTLKKQSILKESHN